jgi:hypothetical protein
MILSKQEAQDKKCCRPGEHSHDCKADGCMGWRWDGAGMTRMAKRAFAA